MWGDKTEGMCDEIVVMRLGERLYLMMMCENDDEIFSNRASLIA